MVDADWKRRRKEVSDSERLFWEKNVDIVTTFLSTNGLIEVTLIAAYSTAMAFLVALGNSLEGSPKEVTFAYVIPALSLAVLILAINVYSWIFVQIHYLQNVASKPSARKATEGYFDFRKRISDRWLENSRWDRWTLALSDGLKYFVLIPFRIRDIYCYYFLIYIFAPIACIAYISNLKEAIARVAVLLALQFLFIAYGLRDRHALMRVSQVG